METSLKILQGTISMQAKPQQLSRCVDLDSRVMIVTGETFLKQRPVKTIREAADSSIYPTLQQIELIEEKRAMDTEGTAGGGIFRVNVFLQDVIRERIVNLISVYGGMNDAMIETLCDMIYDDFPFWTVADVKLCFSKGIKGEYGELKRADVSVIYAWCKKYDAVRTKLIREDDAKKKEQDRVKSMNSSTAIHMPDTFKKLIHKLDIRNAKKRERTPGKLHLSLHQKLSVPKRLKDRILNS